jgi:hypothetical protein
MTAKKPVPKKKKIDPRTKRAQKAHKNRAEVVKLAMPKKKAAPRKNKSRAKPVEEHGDKGRPTKYRPEYDERAMKLCMLGFTDIELATHFDVAESTIHLWKKEHPSFSEHIKMGKDLPDADAAYGLLQRARGMTIPDCHVSVHKGKVTITQLVKHIPPDPNAAMKWLKNRRKDQWKELIAHTDGEGGALGIVINESLKE